MLTLCGFAGSNYYNKVKIALLEKNIPFTEELAWAGQTDLDASPLGKVPYLKTPQGSLCESSVMLEYLEAAHPQTPLLPQDPLAAGKVRELATFLDLHLELVVRNLYPEAFFGGKVSDGLKAHTEKQLNKNLAAFFKLAKFSPFVAGDQFSLADCSAIVHLPLVSMATKQIYGRDFLEGTPAKAYIAAMNERPHMARVNAERKANSKELMARISGKS
jgi:glutathione S-transferase